MSEQAANKLESMFNGLPGILQSALHEPFTWMNNGLKSVAGDPQALLAAAPQYVAIATSVNQIAQAQIADADGLGGSWHGDAYQAFRDFVGLIDDQLHQLSDALLKVPELLSSGADACVEGANMIIDLVTSLLMFAISMAVVNLALAIFTFGLSAAAWVVEVVAAAARTAGQVASVITKVSQVLMKIAEVLSKLARILEKIVVQLKRLQQALSKAKAAAKAAKGADKARKYSAFAGANALTGKAVAFTTGGLVDPPTTFGSAKEGGKDYYDGFEAASDAQDAVR